MRQSRLIPVLLVLSVLLVFGRICTNEFTWWDDNQTIHHNSRMNPPTTRSVLWYWGHVEMGIYIPLTHTVWGVLAAVARLEQPDDAGISLNPWIFHGASVLAHLGTVLAVYGILRRLIGRDWPAFAGAMLFGLHPVQVEAVAWASGLKDVLCGMFAMLAVWQYVIFRSTEEHGRAARATGNYALALTCFVLSMLAKPTGMMAPLLLAILDRLIFRRTVGSILKSLGPWLILSAGCALVARINQPGIGIPNTPLWTRPLLVGDSLAFYLYKLVFPVWLGPDYGRQPAVAMSSAWVYAAWLLPAGLAVLLWSLRKTQPILIAAGLLFVTPMLPVLGLVTFLFQYYSTTADHYLYQPMLGPALALAWVLSRYGGRPLAVLCGIWLALLGLRSIDQAGYWRTDRELWTRALVVNPKSFVAHIQLGNAVARQSQLDEVAHQRALDEAVQHFQAAIALNPNYPKGYESMALYYLSKRQMDKAIEAWEKMLEVLSRQPEAVRGNLNKKYEELRMAQANMATSRPTTREAGK
jgi:hypothetical protein